MKTLTPTWSWYCRGCGYCSSILDFLEQLVGEQACIIVFKVPTQVLRWTNKIEVWKSSRTLHGRQIWNSGHIFTQLSYNTKLPPSVWYRGWYRDSARLLNRAEQQSEGPLRNKIARKSRNSWFMSGGGVGAQGVNWRTFWNQIQTLKDCLCCHIYCAYLGKPWHRTVSASRAVSVGSPGTARSMEDETRNGGKNANQNPEWWGDLSQLVKIEKIKFLGISRYKVELKFWLNLNSEVSWYKFKLSFLFNLNLRLTKISPPFRISICFSFTISSLIFSGTVECNNGIGGFQPCNF